MKIYILLDVYLNSEYHREFVDVFDSAEAVLKYISENQSDGHKFEYIVKEFQDEPTNPLDYPWTTKPYPVDDKHPLQPNKPWDKPADYPTVPFSPITWHYPPCYFGGPCTNPQHDCINCPGLSGGSSGGTWTSDGTGDASDLKLIRQHRTTSGTDSVSSATYTNTGEQVTLQANGQTE